MELVNGGWEFLVTRKVALNMDVMCVGEEISSHI
jgi:hypothetical protein